MDPADPPGERHRVERTTMWLFGEGISRVEHHATCSCAWSSESDDGDALTVEILTHINDDKDKDAE